MPCTVRWCSDNTIASQISTPSTVSDLSAAIIAALESTVISPVISVDDTHFDILLAEDNHVNQKLAVRILEKYGHSIEIAENGAIAVDKYKQYHTEHRPFDIVLVSMPSLLPDEFRAECNVDGCFNAHHGRNGGDGPD
jgi:osomolarity two-component system sensor histidine kinase NIK1